MPPKRKAAAKRAASPVSEDEQPQTKKGKTATKGKKTKAEPVEEDDIPAAQEEKKATKASPEFKEAQVSKGDSSIIPLDEGCTLAGFHVYVDPADGVIFDASLNQTNAGNNNNKFYRIQLLENGKRYHTWTRWGRVGEAGQNAVLGGGSFDDAFSQFNKKFKDKSGLKWDDRGEQPKAKKYVFVERSYELDEDSDADADETAKSRASRLRDDYTPPECTLAKPVASLMELVFNETYFQAAMDSLNYDSEKLPLGKLSKATITRGYQALKNLSDLLDDHSLAQNYEMTPAAAIEHLSNLYYSYIPHSFGRNRPPIINTNERLKREVELLESLTDLKDADLIMKKEKGQGEDVHPLDSRYKGLGMQEMTPLEQDGAEFKGISEYLVNTRGSTHGHKYEVLDIFRIQRDGEEARFKESQYAKIPSDRRLLWHGSRATNYGGILGQGLRIAPPEAPVSGYMFDKGIYLADMASKSANYCYSHISGGEALLLLCDAELGTPMQVLTDAQYDAGATAKAKGAYATWGQGMTGPQGWKDAKCLHPSLADVKMPDTKKAPADTNVAGAYLQYNEYICYDVAQVRMRYLLRVRMS